MNDALVGTLGCALAYVVIRWAAGMRLPGDLLRRCALPGSAPVGDTLVPLAV